MNDHLDLDALADALAAGDSPPHLASCDACRAQLAELQVAMDSIGTALAALPVPPEPEGLQASIATALRQERGAAGQGGDVIPLTTASSRSRLGSWRTLGTGLAAAAALVLGAVLVLRPHPARAPAVTSAAPAFRTNHTGVDYAKNGALLAAELPTLLTGASPKATPEADALTGAAPAAPFRANPAPTPRGAAGLRPAPDPLAPLKTLPGLAACLASLSDPADKSLPLAIDYASFEGQPALVVVLPTHKPDNVDVFVVGAGCAQADAKVLFYIRLAKPR